MKQFSCQANEPNDQMPTEYSERANVCNRLPIWIKYFEYMIHFDSVCSAHNTQFQMNSIHKILCTCLIVCLEFKQSIFFFFSQCNIPSAHTIVHPVAISIMIHFTNVFALWTCIVHLVSLSEQTIAFKSILLADAGVVAIRASMLKMFRFCICILLVVLFLSRTLATTFYVNLIYQSIYSSVERKQFDYIET